MGKKNPGKKWDAAGVAHVFGYELPRRNRFIVKVDAGVSEMLQIFSI